MQSVKDFCQRHHLRLNKDLGQHFLVDESILDTIVETGNIQEFDHIVEIGPGIGVLTKLLLEQAAKVTAIELDERFLPLIQEFTGEKSGAGRLEIINQNALHTPLPEEPYKIIANIPYHITSPLLRHAFLESKSAPTSLTLLIQKEVAERICSKKDASLLSIVVSLFGTPRYIETVPPKAFLPPPKVDSAVLRIDCFDEAIASKEVIEQVLKLTKIGFSMKRKMLRNSFGTFPEGLELLSSQGIDETLRPQQLSIQQWIALATAAAENR